MPDNNSTELQDLEIRNGPIGIMINRKMGELSFLQRIRYKISRRIINFIFYPALQVKYTVKRKKK